MITRVFRAIVHDNKQDEFQEFFLRIALPSVKSHSGLESVSVGRPLPSSPNEFSMVMVWKDIESLKEFAGENWWELESSQKKCIF